MSFERDCAAETVRLHDFLQAWLVGALPRTADAFAAFGDALASDLTVISPNGSVTRRAEIVKEFQNIHGEIAGDRDGFRIWVEKSRVLHVMGDMALASYEEWHRRGQETSARIASVLYRRRVDAPGRVEWVHVHETWLPGKAPKAGERFPEAG